MLGTLVHGEVEGERLSAEELVQNCIFLLNAGHETTTNLVGNTVDALLRFPDQMARLRADPSLIRGCVEEGLRFESSNQLGNRKLTAPLEIADERLEAGTYIHIDIGRTPNRHLAFGSGIHMCLGATLARMEGRPSPGYWSGFPGCDRVVGRSGADACDSGGLRPIQWLSDYKIVN